MSNYSTILKLCRKGDRKAQLEFYMLFYKSVYNSCFRILNSPQEAEDVMQEVFLKVLNRIDSYDEDAGAMERRLKRIAINQAIDIYRKRKVQIVELEDFQDYPEEEAYREEADIQLEAIHEMMQLLPENYRMVITLHLIEGLKHEEIAEQLQISASTVRSQFARAKQQLIHLIKEHYCYENLIG